MLKLCDQLWGQEWLLMLPPGTARPWEWAGSKLAQRWDRIWLGPQPNTG